MRSSCSAGICEGMLQVQGQHAPPTEQLAPGIIVPFCSLQLSLIAAVIKVANYTKKCLIKAVTIVTLRKLSHE